MVPSSTSFKSESWLTKTYSEITELAEKDGSILIVPIGSIEQHGEHLPVGTDTLLADAVASEGIDRISDTVPILGTPPVWLGRSPHHLSFGGTISTNHENFVETLSEIANTAMANEFDAVLLLNGHGGNKSLVDEAVSVIGAEFPSSEVLGLTYFELAAPFVDEIRDSDTGGMSHAGEFETSLMLYLFPELVDEDQLSGTYLDEPYELGQRDLLEGGPLSVYRPFEEYSESGAIGDPSLATVEKGERIHRLIGDELETLLEAIYERNR